MAKKKPGHIGERPGLEVGWSRSGWISARAVRGVKGLTVHENACTGRAESQRGCVSELASAISELDTNDTKLPARDIGKIQPLPSLYELGECLCCKRGASDAQGAHRSYRDSRTGF
jgi:hypothetical protein